MHAWGAAWRPGFLNGYNTMSREKGFAVTHSSGSSSQEATGTWGIPGVRPILQPLGLLGLSALITALTAWGLAHLIISTFAAGWREVLIEAELTGKALALMAILLAAREDFGLSELLRPLFVPRWIGLGVAGGVLAFATEGLVPPASQPLWPLLHRFIESVAVFPAAAAKTASVGAVVAVTAFLSAALEEVLFRGIIQTACDRLWQPVVARTISAVLFAFPHAGFGWVAAVEAFVIGYLLSWIRHRTDSLVLPIWLHATHNVLVFITWLLA